MKALKLEAVCEEQYVEKVIRLPEHDLLVSVLASAVREATSEGKWIVGNSDKERRRRKREARKWILSDKVYCAPGVGISFQFICEALDTDASSIRKTIEDNPKAISQLMTFFRDRSMKRRSLKAVT